MKTKQQRKNDAREEYDRVVNLNWEEYSKKCREIDDEYETKCDKCGK